ncbi:MAG: alpha-glucan family phosphorylase [Planctomycetota bacterium]|nr:alpha-glucan family phosphorylase [Planctomycetota bacterium]
MSKDQPTHRELPAEKLWSFFTAQRLALVEYVGERCATQTQTGDTARGNCDLDTLLDPNVLTIGFARRFATYKRANLLLSEPERLKRLLLDEHRPVQLLVAGKAHPNDGYGKDLIQQMTRFLSQPDLRGRAVFLEDYDMVLGQHLVAGVDVWLNTPLRPNEACGTSGMKVLVNGGLNVSILDGWWDEAVDFSEPDQSRPGWIVGSRDGGSFDELYRRDSASLLGVLEQQVVPEFYDRAEDGIPHRWVERIRESMSRLTPQFSATHMLHQYIDEAYLPAARAYAQRSADGARIATDLLEWDAGVTTHWNHLRIGQVHTTTEGDRQRVNVECWLDDLPAGGVRVELFAESASGESQEVLVLEQTRELPGAVNGFVFSGTVPQGRPVSDFTVRIIPHHPAAFVPIEDQRILWEH